MLRKNSSFKKVLFTPVLLMIFLIVSFKAQAESKEMYLLKIAKVNEINVTVFHKSTYQFPSKVKVIYNNKKTGYAAVSWGRKTYKADKIGVFSFSGRVSGYSKPIKLNVKVVPYVTQAKDINVILNTNEDYMLPKTIPATFSSGINGNANITWSPAVIDTSKEGISNFLGTIAGYNKKIKLNIFIVPAAKELLVETGKELNLPAELHFDMPDGTSRDLHITWKADNVDTRVEGIYNITGKLDGFDKELNWTVKITKIIPVNIPEGTKNISVFVGDKYKLPQSLKAEMLDGTTRDLPVVWEQQEMTFSKAGTVNAVGKVADYNKDIVWTFTVKSDFSCLSKSVDYTQWGYIAVRFSKNVRACGDLSKLQLTNSDGTIIGVREAIPGVTDKTFLIITPSHELEKNKTYKLVIPKNTIQAENGEYYTEDLAFDFNTK